MSSIHRADPHLEEALEILEPYFEQAGRDPLKAYASLPQTMKSFVDEELEHCLDLRYYLENYHVINTKTEGFKTLYPLWDSQEIFLDKIYVLLVTGKRVKVVVLKARQLGLSTISEGVLFWKTIFNEGNNSLVVAQEQKQADYLFDMSRLAYDYLPWWMRPEIRYDAKGRYLMFDRSDPFVRQTNPGLRSQILVDYANKISGLAGVGKTLHAVHISEYSSFADPGVLTEGIFPTMTSNALGIVESTARGRRNPFHDFWKNAVKGDSEWIPVFIESYRIKDYYVQIAAGDEFTLTAEETKIQEKVKEDTGFEIPPEHFKWRRETIREYVNIQGEEGEAMFHQEYPSVSWHEAFQGSGLCAFNKKKLEFLQHTTCRKPRWFGEIDLKEDKKSPRLVLTEAHDFMEIPYQKEYGGRLYLWEMPQEGETYYLGADVAHGNQGGDFSDAQIIRIGRGGEPDKQVAEWHGWITPTKFGYVLAALGYWYNEAQIAVECNDVGILTDSTLFRELDYPNMFRWKHYDKIKNFNTDFLGWYTNSKTRDMIIAKGREAIDDGTLEIMSEELIEEMIDFSQEDIGERFEGQAGNDDRVMGMLICRFCAHDSDFGQQAAAAPRNSHASLIGNLNIEHKLQTPGHCHVCMKPTDGLAMFGPNFSRHYILCPDHLSADSVLKLLAAEDKRRDFANTDFAPAYERKNRSENNKDSAFFGNQVLEVQSTRKDSRFVDPWHPEGTGWIGVDDSASANVGLDELWKLL